ncbi:hypothetical protein [Chengkuizengella marina]|nr:hypothetical protein [Chengkuizengella marina]
MSMFPIALPGSFQDTSICKAISDYKNSTAAGITALFIKIAQYFFGLFD